MSSSPGWPNDIWEEGEASAMSSFSFLRLEEVLVWSFDNSGGTDAASVSVCFCSDNMVLASLKHLSRSKGGNIR